MNDTAQYFNEMQRVKLQHIDDQLEIDRLKDEVRELVEALEGLLADCDADMKPMGRHPARLLLLKHKDSA